MSSQPTPRKRQCKPKIFHNDNSTNKASERQQARTFILWYKKMIDNDRQNLALYLSDDTTLEWFGKTIKTKKKVTAFLKHDMQCTRHDFTTIESIDRIQNRNERFQGKDDGILASPLHSPEVLDYKTSRPGKRRLRSNCNSPEWADGCGPEPEQIEKKKPKLNNHATQKLVDVDNNELKRSFFEDGILENCHKGDGLSQRIKRKCFPVTPPNKEIGQGDCLPSTSGTDSDRSHDALNAQLPRLAVECNGYIEFTRTRNNRSSNDTMKWERKCKVQISYSEDLLNVGEYIIWTLRYTDETRCRRNLLAAFEEAAKEVKV